MTIYQLLKAYKPILRMMGNNGYISHGVRDVEIYEDYMSIIKDGDKKTYAYAVIQERYNIGKTSLFLIIKNMEKEAIV